MHLIHGECTLKADNCRYALPHLRKTQGNIINLSSLVGSMAQVGAVTYVASKGAITAFSKVVVHLHQQLIDEGARDRRSRARCSCEHCVAWQHLDADVEGGG